jgi:hypothetical protein
MFGRSERDPVDVYGSGARVTVFAEPSQRGAIQLWTHTAYRVAGSYKLPGHR